MIFFLAALFVFVINVPFGYWRKGTRKFSLQWFVAIHAPVPLIVAMRSLSGLGYAWYTYAILVPLYFFGQRLGGYIYENCILKRKGCPN